MLNPLQLELTRLIGKKELTPGVIMENKYASEDNPMRFFELIEDMRLVHKLSYQHNGEYKKCSVIKDSESKTEIIGHPATLPDFHRWMNEKLGGRWEQNISFIKYPGKLDMNTGNVMMERGIIPYDSSKDLLSQSEETLKQIVELIKSSQ